MQAGSGTTIREGRLCIIARMASLTMAQHMREGVMSSLPCIKPNYLAPHEHTDCK